MAVRPPSDLDRALDEIARLRKAITDHRDAVCAHPRAAWLHAIDLDLWLALKHNPDPEA